jgi:cGMP-dependent protein kinase
VQDKLLDRELKPPYVPPKEKLISDAEIKKMDQLGKKVITELEVTIVYPLLIFLG